MNINVHFALFTVAKRWKHPKGSFVDRLLHAVNIHDADSLRYFHKVLRNKGIFDEVREMGIKDGDMVNLNDFEFEYMM